MRTLLGILGAVMQSVSGILDVAIGLVFIYLLLSLVCSAMTEAVENSFNHLRGKKLCEGLYELFGGNANQDQALQMVKDFYNNPLVYGLYKGDIQLQTAAGKQKLRLPQNLPSYISPRTFALAFASQLMAGNALDTAALAEQIKASPILHEPLKHSLLIMVSSAGNDIHQALGNIEHWYSAMGERVSGWYKQHAQRVAFVVALAIAVAGNVDSIMIAKSLMLSDVLRSQMVAAAGQYAQIGSSAPAREAVLCPSANTSPEQCYQLQMRQLTELSRMGLPIGWQNQDDPRLWPKDGWAWFEKCLGIFLTVIAVSLGAPFWFDVLNKFMNFRSSLKPKAELDVAAQGSQDLAKQPHQQNAGVG